MLRIPELSDMASPSDKLSHCLTRVISHTYQHTLCVPASPFNLRCTHLCSPSPTYYYPALSVLSEGTHIFPLANEAEHKQLYNSFTPGKHNTTLYSGKVAFSDLFLYLLQWGQNCISADMPIYVEQLGEVCSLCCGCETSCGLLPAERLQCVSCDRLCFAEQ